MRHTDQDDDIGGKNKALVKITRFSFTVGFSSIREVGDRSDIEFSFKSISDRLLNRTATKNSDVAQ